MSNIIIHLSGGYSEGVPPVPIPNTVVKPFSADDTSGATPWESRSLPEFLLKGQAYRLPFSLNIGYLTEQGIIDFVLTFLQVDKLLRKDGFEFTHVRGSHHHYKHPETGNGWLFLDPLEKRTIFLWGHYGTSTVKLAGIGEIGRNI